MNRNRDVVLSIDGEFQRDLAAMVSEQVRATSATGAAVVVADADVLEPIAVVSYPWPGTCADVDKCIDRARTGWDTPGSAFKGVTALAALLQGSKAFELSAYCMRLPDGRCGSRVMLNRTGTKVTILVRDDQHVKHPHGQVGLRQAFVASCNGAFANFGVSDLVGAEGLLQVGRMLEMRFAASGLHTLALGVHQAAFGQGPVAVSAMEMMKVPAFAASKGNRGDWRWRLDREPPARPVPTDRERWAAGELASMMRQVVLERNPGGLRSLAVDNGGKTGTATNGSGAPHSWWIGWAKSSRRTLCFTVVFFNAGYGADVAAPFAKDLLEKAMARGIL